MVDALEGCAEWEVTVDGGLGMNHCWQSLAGPPALLLGGEGPAAELGMKPHTGAALPSEGYSPGRKTGSQMLNHSPRIQSTLGDQSEALQGSPLIQGHVIWVAGHFIHSSPFQSRHHRG